MKGLVQPLYSLLMIAFASAQYCPNNIAVYDPNVKTSCNNGTFFIVPVPTAAVQSAVAPYKLVPLPTSDKTLFPNGFPAGKRPVLVSIEIQNDVRGGPLQTANLLSSSIQVPYVDRLGDGKTGFLFSVKQYIGGTNGNSVVGLLPAVVSTLGGLPVYVASFVPSSGPYEQISTPPPEYIAQVKDVIVPNPVSGPIIIEEAIDTDFFTTATSMYTAHTFYEFISQPLIVTNGMYLRNEVYFNQTFTNPIFRDGTVILYSPGGTLAGVYSSAQGYSASGENVAYTEQSCSTAAAMTDPKALA